MTRLADFVRALPIPQLPEEVPRLLRALGGYSLGPAWVLDEPEVAARIGAGLPPVLLPVATDGARTFSLHLHPALVAMGRFPVVACLPDGGEFVGQADALPDFAAQLHALEEVRPLPRPEDGLTAIQSWRKIRWALGREPWVSALTPSVSADAPAWTVFVALGIDGPVHRLAEALERLAAAPRREHDRLLRDLLRDSGLDGPTAWFVADRSTSPVLRDAALSRAAATPRYAQAVRTGDSEGGPTRTSPESGPSRSFEEALSAGHLLGDYAPILPVAREAALRMPERDWLVPLLDLHAP